MISGLLRSTILYLENQAQSSAIKLLESVKHWGQSHDSDPNAYCMLRCNAIIYVLRVET